MNTGSTPTNPDSSQPVTAQAVAFAAAMMSTRELIAALSDTEDELRFLRASAGPNSIMDGVRTRQRVIVTELRRRRARSARH